MCVCVCVCVHVLYVYAYECFDRVVMSIAHSSIRGPNLEQSKFVHGTEYAMAMGWYQRGY